MNRKRRSRGEQEYQPERNKLTKLYLGISGVLLAMLLLEGGIALDTLYRLKHMRIPPIIEPGTGQKQVITGRDGLLDIEPVVIDNLP